MQGASAPATVTEGRRAPADWDLSLPSAAKGFLSSSVSCVCQKLHRNQYEVARVSRVTPLSPCDDCNHPFAAEEQTKGFGGRRGHEGWDKGGVIPICWGSAGFPRPGVSQEAADGIFSQMALVWSWKEVTGAAGGKPRAPVGAVGAAGAWQRDTRSSRMLQHQVKESQATAH